ncbi:hypothetical protein AVP3_0072 [Aeromonas phage AVP3]
MGDAIRFYQALLDETESFNAVAEVFGADCLASVIYLQGAMMTGSYCDFEESDSIMAFLATMPEEVQTLAAQYIAAPVGTYNQQES